MNSKLKGTLCGVGAAVSYGTNPLGTLPLYADGINTNTILFGRYGLAVIILGIIMLLQRKSFAVTHKELLMLAPLGVLFVMSSITLYVSFLYMDAGIASTLLFVYPVLVAVMMALFFKERITISTILSITLALSGISLLYRGSNGATLSTMGVLMVMISSLTYALYIVILNKSSLRMSSMKLTFYVLIFGTIVIIINSFLSSDGHLQMLTTASQWIHVCILATFPTVVSLLLMVIAIHEVGSTPAAIMGALEPITAVAIGVLIFGEAFTLRLAVGILLVLFAVILIVVGKSMSVHRITHVIGKLGDVFVKHWRWK